MQLRHNNISLILTHYYGYIPFKYNKFNYSKPFTVLSFNYEISVNFPVNTFVLICKSISHLSHSCAKEWVDFFLYLRHIATNTVFVHKYSIWRIKTNIYGCTSVLKARILMNASNLFVSITVLCTLAILYLWLKFEVNKATSYNI